MGRVRKICRAAMVGAGLTGIALALMAPRMDGPAEDGSWDELRGWRYAHRGLFNPAEGRPENSRAAFRAAAQARFGVELDVHLMADGNLVVVHDSNLARVCGKEGVVEQLTLEELEGYRLEGSNERPPLLDEVLSDLENEAGAGQSPIPAIVELKPAPDNAFRLTQRVMECLDAHHVPYCVESFDPRVLVWLRIHRPEVVRGQLAERHVFAQVDGPVVPKPLERPVEAAAAWLMGNVAGRPDFIAYRFDDRNSPPVRLLTRAFNPHMAVWTIRDEDSLAEADRMGAISIFDSFVPET